MKQRLVFTHSDVDNKRSFIKQNVNKQVEIIEIIETSRYTVSSYLLCILSKFQYVLFGIPTMGIARNTNLIPNGNVSCIADYFGDNPDYIILLMGGGFEL